MLRLLAILLGLYAGLTVYLGFLVIRVRGIDVRKIIALNAMAIGLLGYLDIDLSTGLLEFFNNIISSEHAITMLTYSIAIGIAALVTILILSVMENWVKKMAIANGDPNVIAFSLMTAIGIGIHNLGVLVLVRCCLVRTLIWRYYYR